MMATEAARVPRMIASETLGAGGELFVYECIDDAWERMAPDARGVSIRSLAAKQKMSVVDAEKAYSDHRMPFEVLRLERLVNGMLDYGTLKIRAFKTEVEARAHYEMLAGRTPPESA
jgi:hypothetical protein